MREAATPVFRAWQPKLLSTWPRLLKPLCLGPVLHKGSHPNEEPVHHQSSPCSPQRDKPRQQRRLSTAKIQWLKINKKIFLMWYSHIVCKQKWYIYPCCGMHQYATLSFSFCWWTTENYGKFISQEELVANIPNGETLQIFPLKSREKRLSSSFLFNIQQGFYLTLRQKKKRKRKRF